MSWIVRTPRWLLLLLAAAALVVPGAPTQVFGGTPLGVAGLIAAALVMYAGLALPTSDWSRARWLAFGLAAAMAIKLAAAGMAPPVGVEVSYWAAAEPSGRVERSTDFQWLSGGTRIDPALDWRGEDFAVHFFNDAARFNFGPDVAPGRDQLPFTVQCQAWLLVPSDGERRFVVDAAGSALLELDGQQLTADETLPLRAGLHPLSLTYSRPEAQVPMLRVRWQRDPGDALEVLAAPDLRWQPSDGSLEPSRVFGAIADVVLGAAIAAWLLSGASRLRHQALARAALGLIPLAFLAYGVLLEAPAAGRATILSGLDDWLVYESSARDVLLNGMLMDGGQGHAPPFYGQPLYPYVLALAHRLTGESLFGPLVVQFAALGLVAAGVAVLARRAFGMWLDGLAALACFVVLLQLEPEHLKIARQLFNENLYMPLVMASLVLLVTYAQRPPPRWWHSLLAGVVLGLTAISRSQFLLFLPFGLLSLALAWRRRAVLHVPVLLIGVVMAILPVTARNWLVSGQFVPIATSAGASLLEFHRPPAGLIDQAAIQTDPLYNALHLDQATRTVLAFARADPRAYLATLLPLGAHSLGLQGRNDPGVYWPLFVTVLAYSAAFGLRRTRRLRVLPIHAFVATHLLLLMLFEADTYGYRLVMPMYAPMVAVAAQVPLAALRALFRSRPEPNLRMAHVGWIAVLLAAMVWQARGLAELWPEREPALHGLGAAAASAALAADQVGASAVYVASIDGLPRRFGSGSLTGLRYPPFKWFDPVRTLPLPLASRTAVYMLQELSGHSASGDLTVCLGPPGPGGEVVIDGASARQRCAGPTSDTAGLDVIFDGLARVESVSAPASATAGDALEIRLIWQPLVVHPEPYATSVQLDDPASAENVQFGNGTLDLYPSTEWQTDELLVSRLPVATDPTAIPQTYRLTLGMAPLRPDAQPAMTEWHGSRTDRVPIGSVSLNPGPAPAAGTLPAGMRAVTGAPEIGGGIALVGARPIPAEAAVGGSMRIGLLWRALRDEPTAADFKVRLVGGTGQVVQESVLPVLGGHVATSVLRAGNVVRDEQWLTISSKNPTERMAVELVGPDASVELGSVTLTGRPHVWDEAGQPPEATLGKAMALLSHEATYSDGKITVKLRWRAAAGMEQAYKVFIHLLSPDLRQVIAQRDAEPQDGKAPTASWVPGEIIDDQYVITIPTPIAAGQYPLELGAYDPRTGQRLTLDSGDNRLLLPPLRLP